MRAAVTVAVTVTLGLSSIAAADPPGMTPVNQPELATQPDATALGTPNYRGWTVGLDLTAVALLALAIDRNDEGLAKLAVGTYVLGAPIVHISKGKGARAVASVGMRVGFPIIGAALGAAMHEDSYCDYNYDYECSDDDFGEEAAMGFVVGIITASAIDSIYLAKGDPPKQPQRQWAPMVRSTSGGFALGVNGRF